jgi:hypothetical protein
LFKAIQFATTQNDQHTASTISLLVTKYHLLISNGSKFFD